MVEVGCRPDDTPVTVLPLMVTFCMLDHDQSAEGQFSAVTVEPNSLLVITQFLVIAGCITIITNAILHRLIALLSIVLLLLGASVGPRQGEGAAARIPPITVLAPPLDLTVLDRIVRSTIGYAPHFNPRRLTLMYCFELSGHGYSFHYWSHRSSHNRRHSGV